MKTTKIFPLTEGDLSEVRGLVSQLGYSCYEGELTERFGKLMKLSQHALKVWKDDQVRGVIHLEEVFDLIEEKKVEIKALVVDEESRSRGIGRALLEEAAQWAKERGCTTMYLSCNIKREKAHSFYLRESFALLKTAHFFERKL